MDFKECVSRFHEKEKLIPPEICFGKPMNNTALYIWAPKTGPYWIGTSYRIRTEVLALHTP